MKIRNLLLLVSALFLCSAFASAASNLAIALSSLPEGNPQVPYHATVVCTGGTPPFTWSIVSGQLPTGLTLNSATGVIEGTPTQAGPFTFEVEVTDSSSPRQTQGAWLTIHIESPPPGPATLPQVFIDTTFPNTTGCEGLGSIFLDTYTAE